MGVHARRPQYASELVALLQQRDDLSVGVAAFPEGHRDAASLEDDARVLKAKHDAGAEFAITEMVLRVADYTDLVRRAAEVGADLPIVPGIMPILNLSSMRTMVRMSGREMPAETLARILPLEDDPVALRAEGIRIATELCEQLLDRGCAGAALLHAEPVQGDARDLRRPPAAGVTAW